MNTLQTNRPLPPNRLLPWLDEARAEIAEVQRQRGVLLSEISDRIVRMLQCLPGEVEVANSTLTFTGELPGRFVSYLVTRDGERYDITSIDGSMEGLECYECKTTTPMWLAMEILAGLPDSLDQHIRSLKAEVESAESAILYADHRVERIDGEGGG